MWKVEAWMDDEDYNIEALSDMKKLLYECEIEKQNAYRQELELII